MTTEANQDAGQSLRAHGWHQGALIPVPEALASACCGYEHAVVASQDCDIVALTENEPAVDVLPAAVQTDSVADLLHGKHPRRLCLPLTDGRFAVVDVRQRVTVTKDSVAAIEPLVDASVDAKSRKLLAKWLGKRYARPAFPDAFNERLRGQQKTLEKLSKRDEGKRITAIFVMLNTEEELSSGESYQIVVWFACRAADVDDSEQRASLEKYASEFAHALECAGVVVAEHELRGHFDITLEDLEQMKRFDWDFRSEAPKPGGQGLHVE